MHSFRIAALAGTIAAALAMPAFAQGAYGTVPTPQNDGMRYQNQQSQQTGLQPKQEGDVTFITGGIGDSEVDQLKSQADNYNFQMINSDPTGHYTADMDLVIQSKDGREMVRVNDAGPLFYAQLPPGEYKVEATHDGRTETKTVRISAHGAPAKTVMIWR
jgi:hypothetical protein